MRIWIAMFCGMHCLFPEASAQDKAAKSTLIKPVQVWEGRFDRDEPASGKYSIDVITDARSFGIPWKIFRWEQKVPAIKFDEHFAVLLIYPGFQYALDGLKVDDQGDAKVAGSGIEKAVAVPHGKWYVLAIFPRAKVKSVDGVKILSGK